MAAADQPRVLVADPSARMRRLLRINLEAAGFAVSETAGADLDQRVRSETLDALVLNLDGRDPAICEPVHVLRRRNEGAVVAGYSILPVDERVRHLCMDLYVETPFDVAQFATWVRRSCERSAALAGVTGAELAL